MSVEQEKTAAEKEDASTMPAMEGWSQRVRMPLLLLALALALTLLYGGFLSNPPVFDDITYFGPGVVDPFSVSPSLKLRDLSHATFAWVTAVFGADLAWQRGGNLALHIVNSWLVFLLLRRLFETAMRDEPQSAKLAVSGALTLPWLAFWGTCWFALNPASVYGVAYLMQRTTLLATTFALLTWLLFLEGLLRTRRRWLLASCLAYFLAVLSKEHAIMVPAVAVAILLLFRRPTVALVREFGLTFFMYALIGLYTVVQVKRGGIVGSPYEPFGAAMLAELHIDPKLAYPLSLLGQCLMFFRYLLLWVVPNPQWMSIDMPGHFPQSLLSWPQTAFVPLFLAYPLVATYLLLKRGRTGLLGFSLLVPWLLFATELSTVRIQEIFVLYRSYLWMPCLAAAFPFIFGKLSARYTAALFVALSLAFAAGSWNRLTTMSTPLRVWDDALRLAQGKDKTSRMGRIYHSRGMAYLRQEQYAAAILDFDAGLNFLPYHSWLYSDRGVAYFYTKRYAEALRDFNRSIMLDPNDSEPYLGRYLVYDALGDKDAARQNLIISCRMRFVDLCRQAQ